VVFPKDQRIYTGFVTTRELNHDADLIGLQKAAEEVRETGGKHAKFGWI